MKLETNLRPQDKRTIGIVIFVAVVALFCWYLVRPAWIKLGDLDDKIQQEEERKQEYRMKTINLASAEVLYDKAVTDITSSTTDFYDVMDNSEIEKMGTKYILKFGLTPVNFNIDLRDGSYVAETPYQYSDIKAPTTTKKKTSSSTTTTPTPTEAAKKTTKKTSGLDVQSLQVYYNDAVSGVKNTTPSQVQCARITIVIQGPKNKCQSLIDDITKNPSIRVRGFSWSNVSPVYSVDSEGNKILMNGGYSELKLDLNFYMCDKPQFDNEEG